MSCTTILAGRNATYDGSCLIARNDDSGAGHYTAKKFVVVEPDQQPRQYESVISHVKIELPDDPMRYTAMPNAVQGQGTWAAAGINAANVSMTATETITSNALVQGADPLVVYDPETGTPGGIGEEDIVVLTLPYIHTAREGVLRLGQLLEKYGTYEMNGIAFADVNEVWYLETIGGHHWMARRLPDDCYAVIPNQLGLDEFDFADAYGAKENYLCSPDLKQFVEENHLDLNLDGKFNPRLAFGSHDDADYVYNTPRAWYVQTQLNPSTASEIHPYDDDLAWCRVPEHKITVEEVKTLLSSHFQRTPYDPYTEGPDAGKFRCIGINRTAFLSVSQMRPDNESIEWIAFAANPFNVLVPYYADVKILPNYVSDTTGTVNTDSFYWTSRLIAAMADASFKTSQIFIERYQNAVAGQSHALLNKYDAQIAQTADPDTRMRLREKANEEITNMVKAQAEAVLDKVLYNLSNQMKDAFSRSDA